jgi:uncharacterized membrane protein
VADIVGLERSLGRLISVGTLLAVALIALGVALMILAGRSPLEVGFAPFDPAALAAQLRAGRAEGFLWLGVAVAIATPAARVAAALVGYARRGEQMMVVVAAAILAVIAVGVLLGVLTG